MEAFLRDSGLFVYPLGLLSLVGVAVVFERIWALRTARIAPPGLFARILDGGMPEPGQADRSMLAEILRFRRDQAPSPETLRAYGRFLTSRMERGLFLIDVVVAGAPLLGLLGTVTGLVRVFSGFSPGDGLPDTTLFVEGIGMALTTTILGLGAAIPALVCGAWLNRRVELLGSRIDVAVEKLAEDLERAGGGEPEGGGARL